MNYPSRLLLLNFLQARRVLEGGVVYFSLNDEKQVWLVLDEQQQELATTSRDAVLLFITTYNTTMVEEDEHGTQLWQLQLDSLTSPRDSGGFASSFIRH